MSNPSITMVNVRSDDEPSVCWTQSAERRESLAITSAGGCLRHPHVQVVDVKNRIHACCLCQLEESSSADEDEKVPQPPMMFLNGTSSSGSSHEEKSNKIVQNQDDQVLQQYSDSSSTLVMDSKMERLTDQLVERLQQVHQWRLQEREVQIQQLQRQLKTQPDHEELEIPPFSHDDEDDTRLQLQQRRHDSFVSLLKDSHQQEIKSLQEAHQQEIIQLKQQHQQEMDSTKQSLQEQIQRLQKTIRRQDQVIRQELKVIKSVALKRHRALVEQQQQKDTPAKNKEDVVPVPPLRRTSRRPDPSEDKLQPPTMGRSTSQENKKLLASPTPDTKQEPSPKEKDPPPVKTTHGNQTHHVEFSKTMDGPEVIPDGTTTTGGERKKEARNAMQEDDSTSDDDYYLNLIKAASLHDVKDRRPPTKQAVPPNQPATTTTARTPSTNSSNRLPAELLSTMDVDDELSRHGSRATARPQDSSNWDDHMAAQSFAPVENGRATSANTRQVENTYLQDSYGDCGTFTGTIVNEVPQGEGWMRYDDGREYDGQWSFGRWHGKGRLLNRNGDCYEGDFQFDSRHGHGIYKWAGGNYYEGQFLKDNRSGKGLFRFANGNVYTGDFVNGVFEGQGRYVFEGGSYEGQWKNGRYDGYGTIQYDDGGRYTGEFLDGIPREEYEDGGAPEFVA